MGRIGGLVTASKYGSAHMAAVGRRSTGRYVYGRSDGAVRLRMIDLRAKQSMSAADWRALQLSREASLGLTAGTLTGALPATQPKRPRGRPPLSLAQRLGRDAQQQTG